MPCVPTCQRGLRANMFACQRGLRANMPACQHAKSVPSSRFYVPTYQKACQRNKRRVNVSTWHANVPNGMRIFQLAVPTCQRACQFFKHSFYEMLREISKLYHYIKNSRLYLISYFYMPCVYVSYI